MVSPIEEASLKLIRELLDETTDDVMKVFEFGATKHPPNGVKPNFLEFNGNKCSRRVRGSSCLRHAAELFSGVKEDHESGLHPALHLMASAFILYIRDKNGIIHTDDRGNQ